MYYFVFVVWRVFAPIESVPKRHLDMTFYDKAGNKSRWLTEITLPEQQECVPT